VVGLPHLAHRGLGGVHLHETARAERTAGEGESDFVWTDLGQIVEVSEQLKATRSRTAKIAAIARLLQGRTAHELRTIVAWMSGELLQGRIGISKGRAHQYARGVAASDLPGLTIEDVDRALVTVQGASGPGSLGVRERVLHELLAEATQPEQRFLVSLLAGELRQGALGGVMIEGIATAAGVPGAVVRRAAMLSGGLPGVALTAFKGGESALRRIELELFRPVVPMLAQTADTPSDALARKSPLVFKEKLDGMRLQLHRQGGGHPLAGEQARPGRCGPARARRWRCRSRGTS
jgi:DNA ligase-1